METRLSVRVSEEELTAWSAKSSGMGVSLSEWIRSLDSTVTAQAMRISSLELDLVELERARELAQSEAEKFRHDAERLRVEIDTMTRMFQMVQRAPPMSHAPVTAQQAMARQGVVASGVGNAFWDRWARESKRYYGDERDQFFKDSVNDRVASGLRLPSDWNKRQFPAKMAWLRQNDHEAEQ